MEKTNEKTCVYCLHKHEPEEQYDRATNVRIFLESLLNVLFVLCPVTGRLNVSAIRSVSMATTSIMLLLLLLASFPHQVGSPVRIAPLHFALSWASSGCTSAARRSSEMQSFHLQHHASICDNVCVRTSLRKRWIRGSGCLSNHAYFVIPYLLITTRHDWLVFLK